jgi:hypothetical protein
VENKLTNFERIFIQLQLTKLTDEEIADMLNQPVDVVHAAIDKMTGGGIIKKSLLQKQKERLELLITKRKSKPDTRVVRKQKAIEQKEAAAVKKGLAAAKRLEDKRLKKLNDDRRKEQERLDKLYRLSKPYKQAEKVFASVNEDLSNKIAVKIDHKTTVYVKPGTDIDKIKKQYRKIGSHDTSN